MFYVFTVRSAAAVSCLRCMRMYVYYRRVLTVTKILGFGICEHVTLCHSPSTLEVLRTCLLHIGPTNDRRRVPVRGRESPSLFGHAGGRASDRIPEAKRILYLRDLGFPDPVRQICTNGLYLRVPSINRLQRHLLEASCTILRGSKKKEPVTKLTVTLTVKL